MKIIAIVLVSFFIILIISGCNNGNYKNQPWMPSKSKGKSNGQSKKASITQREYNNF